MTESDWGQKVKEITQEQSFFHWDLEFLDIFYDEDGKRKENPGFDVVIGNPPYVRQELLQDKEHMQLSKNSDLAEYVIPSKMDLSGYFFYHSLNILQDMGKIGFIASESWLSFEYGKSLQKLLLDKCRIVVLMRTEFNIFDADVRTITTILEKSTNSNNTTKLIYAKKEKDLLQTDIKYIEKQQNEFEVGNWNSYFSENQFIPRIEMKKLSDVGNVKRGKTTGCNDFFILTKDIIEKYNITKKYLVPLVSGDIEGVDLHGISPTQYLLNVNEPKDELSKTSEGKNVLRYINELGDQTITPKKGANKKKCKVCELATVRNRKLWYSLGFDSEPPTIILARFAHDRMKIYENNGVFYAKDNCVWVTPANNNHTRGLLAYLATSWFSLYLEKNGHPAGGGALQFLTGDYKKSPVPDFKKMPKDNIKKMKEAWCQYKDGFDQKKLDDTVFDILGFTSDERKQIETELKLLIKQRTKDKKSK